MPIWEAIGFPADHVNALIKNDAYVALVDKARHRRLALAATPVEEQNPKKIAEKNAIASLLNVVALSKDTDLLDKIARVQTNKDLDLEGLDLKLIAALNEGSTAYETIAQAAKDRLEQLTQLRNQNRTLYLTDSIPELPLYKS